MAKKKIKIMCTAFRDGFQSVIGARVLSEDFLPAVKIAYDAGIRWFEAGGGARFQSCYFYCREDAFKVMDDFRAICPDADLQTLSRGVNVVGLDSQSSDMIKLHADLFKKHGISSTRNFDALNDVENLRWSGQCIHDAGLKHEIAITMMGLPPGVDNQGTHTPEFYAGRLQKIIDAKIPFDRLVFKDASGTSAPSTVYKTIKLCREVLKKAGKGNTHIQFHSHETAGNAISCYLAAIRGGADGLDLSMAPLSGGTCQPDIITMWHALEGDPDYELDIGDINKVRQAEQAFKDCLAKYFIPPEAMNASPAIIWSPMPGGALTANTQMLRDMNMMDKYDQMISEMYDCVRLGGFGTSVTPVSQFYAQQAMANVMYGKWKKITDGYGRMLLGYFGKTPVAPDPELVKLAAEQLKMEPTTKKVLDINNENPNKGRKAAEKMLADAGLPVTDENVFIAASCKEKGILFLKDPANAPLGIRLNEPAKKAGAAANGPCTVTINGKAYGVELKGDKAVVNGKEVAFTVADGLPAAGAPPAAKAGGASTEIKAPVPGTVLRITSPAGTAVSEGDEILVLDVMKMETPVTAPCAGTVLSVDVAQADKVSTDQLLATIG